MSESFDTNRTRRERETMVRQQIIERGIDSPRVLQAFMAVPRHLFVPPALLSQAYDDRPLYIGSKQTISQPYIVALMTDALNLTGTEKVLDIGTGSGYQAAILAEIVEKVYTVERIPELSQRAERLLHDYGVDNVEFLIADGTKGWSEHAPYDAVVIAAAAPAVPESLKTQLADEGRLVIPVGQPHSQTLTLLTRTKSGFTSRKICPCIFVKLIGEEGFQTQPEP